MSTEGLVLSLFSGVGMLDEAFREAGYCVVSAGDVIWGSLYDVRRFHPPAGVFDGVIGGPPCQAFSALVHLVRANGYEPHFGNLIPEYERVVAESQPRWFVMENVTAAPMPAVDGYQTHSQILDNRWLGEEQKRARRISFGTRDGRALQIEIAALEAFATVQAVVSSTQAVPVKLGGSGKVKSTFRRVTPPTVTSNVGGYSAANAKKAHGGTSVRFSIADACRLQGLPEDFLSDAPFTAEGKLKAIANGVPLPMGRAIARAVQRALSSQPAHVGA